MANKADADAAAETAAAAHAAYHAAVDTDIPAAQAEIERLEAEIAAQQPEPEPEPEPEPACEEEAAPEKVEHWAKLCFHVDKKMKVKKVIKAVNACISQLHESMAIEALVPLWTPDY